MTYEELLINADDEGLITKEKDLQAHDGRIKGNKIAIRRSIETEKEKACVMAEELGHYYTSSGDILDTSDTANAKQERRARIWAYDKLIGLDGIIKCWKNHAHSTYEMAEICGVDEAFLKESIKAYRQKYGICVRYGNYLIYFEPTLGVMEMLK